MLSHDQEKLLEEASNVVKEQAFYMKKAIDEDNLRDALRHASNMLCEMRTSFLSPKNYYELYMRVFQELQHLGAFCSDSSRHNRRMGELYESVQHAGNIVPRLYLLVTVGAVYVKSMDAPAKTILKDMTELCKGVQHPMRGLFLRYYLTQMCKDKLPDRGSVYEANGGGDFSDAFEFLFTNFCEATRLWIRLQHQGNTRDREKREKERHDMRVLVGASLVRMAQLDGMTVEYYKDTALPELTSFIIQCKDAMAQQYFLDCIIQAFSDECHLYTLGQLLSTSTSVEPSVDTKLILSNLMNRLASFVQQNSTVVPEDVDIFSLFCRHLSELQTRSSNDSELQSYELGSLLELRVSFLSFSLSLYPNDVDKVSQILASTALWLQRNSAESSGKVKYVFGRGVDSIIELFSKPLRALPISILNGDHYSTLIQFLDDSSKRKVAIALVSVILEAETAIDDVPAAIRLIEFLNPLHTMRDFETATVEDINVEQQYAKLVHLFQHEDTNKCYLILEQAIPDPKVCGEVCIATVYPALVVCFLRLAHRVARNDLNKQDGSGCTLSKLLQQVHRLCDQLTSSSPEVAIRLCLQSAIVSDSLSDGNGSGHPFTDEFLTQALIVFEEELSSSRVQADALIMIIAILSSQIKVIDRERYENYCTKITQHASRLLAKKDQCSVILECTHLFWENQMHRNERRVVECLEKCLKIAKTAVISSPTNSTLFIAILNKYICYYVRRHQLITKDAVKSVIACCNEYIQPTNTDTKLALNWSLKYFEAVMRQ